MSLPGNRRLQPQRYSMVGEICNSCGAKLFPPRDVCPECHNGAPWSKNGEGQKTENLEAGRDISAEVDKGLMEGSCEVVRRRPEG